MLRMSLLPSLVKMTTPFPTELFNQRGREWRYQASHLVRPQLPIAHREEGAANEGNRKVMRVRVPLFLALQYIAQSALEIMVHCAVVETNATHELSEYFEFILALDGR
jgi:hypothetical protein